MNKHLENERLSIILFLTVWVLNAIIYMSKIAYSAAIASIVSEGFLSKSNSGAISAAFYLTFGIGQFLGGPASDKHSPYKLVFIGVLGSCICNCVMAMCNSFVPMLIIWSINGIIQFGLWSSVIRIVVTHLYIEHRRKATIYINLSSLFGSVLSYVIAASVSKWQHIFVISSIALATITVLWALVSLKCNKELVEDKPIKKKQGGYEETPKLSPFKLIMTSGLIFIMIAALTRCMLDLGIKTWVPTMITETYSYVIPAFASALTIIILVFNGIGVLSAKYIYPKLIKNEILAVIISLLCAVPFLCGILLNRRISVGYIVVFLTFMTTIISLSGQFVSIIIPSKFAFYGKSGTVTGIINAMASFGCVIANYGYGFLADKFSWGITVLVWIGLMILTILLVLAAYPLWNRFFKNVNQGKANELITKTLI